MAELASRTATGGVIGDTFEGYKIEAIQADGVYAWSQTFVQTVEQPVPTSMVIQTVAGNQSGNGLTTNGVYRSNNSGALQNVGFGNWTWRIKVTRIGDWVQQHYWNDTGNIAYRESYNAGSNWTSWGN